MYINSWTLVTSVTTTTPYMSNLLVSPLEVKITQATCTLDVHLLCIALYVIAFQLQVPAWSKQNDTCSLVLQQCVSRNTCTLPFSHRLSRCGRFQHHWHYLHNSIPWLWTKVSKVPTRSGERDSVPWQWGKTWQVSDESCHFDSTNKDLGIPARISFPCPKCGLGLLFRYRKWGIVAQLLFFLQLSLSLTLYLYHIKPVQGTTSFPQNDSVQLMFWRKRLYI